MEMWLIWLIVCGSLLILEIFTISFLLFWPGITAFFVLLLSLIGIPAEIQMGLFFIISILLMIFTKPLTDKYFKVKDANLNANSIIGKKGYVLKTIDNINTNGQVKINGEVWSALSEDGSIIPVDAVVEVLSIKGVKLIVKLKGEK